MSGTLTVEEEMSSSNTLNGIDNKAQENDNALNVYSIQMTVKEEDDGAIISEREQKMLSVLREIANSCCHANPSKRPTAEKVLSMLQQF